MTNNPIASNKTILITGASTGLGNATAKLFAERGWNVIATMRRPEQASDLAAIDNIRLLELDVTQPEQITKAATEALASGPVDVLFNNAGYGLAGPFEGATDEQIVRQLDTNLLGVMRVTQAFVPYFRERKAGLILTTTSIGGLVTFPFNSVYHATKWALEGWSESLAFELNPFGIRVKTVAPGGIKTDFTGRSLARTTHDAYSAAVQTTFQRFMDPNRALSGSSAEQIAEVVWEAVTDDKDKVCYVAGEDAKKLYEARQKIGSEAFRAMIRKEFLQD